MTAKGTRIKPAMGNVALLAPTLALILMTSPLYAQPCNNPKGGCPATFGVPTGGVFEFNESFLTDAIRNAWDANGLGSPRGAFFLGDPATDTDDNLDGYLKTEPLAIKSDFLLAQNFQRLKWADREPGMWDDVMNQDDDCDCDVDEDTCEDCPDEDGDGFSPPGGSADGGTVTTPIPPDTPAPRSNPMMGLTTTVTASTIVLLQWPLSESPLMTVSPCSGVSVIRFCRA